MSPPLDRSDWDTLPRRRLRPAGQRGPDALTWLTRLVTASLVISAGWWLYVTLRPLPALPAPPEVQIPSAPSLDLPQPSIGLRQDRLAELSRENLFAADRRPWPIAHAQTDPPPDLPEPDAPPPTVAAEPSLPTSAPLVTADGRAIVMTPPDQLPDDVRQALDELELRGVFRGIRGPTAMIGFVHSPNRFMTQRYVIGDEFTEPRHDQQQWRVEAVDLGRQRVALSRSDATVLLSMYALASARSRLDDTGSPLVPRIVPATRDRVVADLKQAGFSDEEIARLMTEVENPSAAVAAEKLRRLADGQSINDTGPDLNVAGKASRTPRSPPQMPPALRALFRQMAEQTAERNRKKAGDEKNDDN